MKNPWIIISIIIVILLGGSFWFSSSTVGQSDEGVTLIEHRKGNPDALVTLVEYSDFQCPACAAFQPIVNGMIEQYGDRLQFEYKHFPLPPRIHPYAFQASVAAEAAGQQGKFFEFGDMLFEKQDAWAKSAVPATLFVQYASDLGLDVDSFKRHMKSSLLRDRVQADFSAGEVLKVDATPTFFLNGEKMKIESYLDFAQQIGYAIDPAIMSTTTASTTDSTNGVRFGF
ncbi:thioredoxin domain-containing protein [Candidatus Kaiserbacteria bacterium]|nr:thioredoxin domain-containing protein [Candidatus Kaiserbacteria bacterium]